MPLHVRITAKDPRRRSKDALALDKDVEWLEEYVLAPRRQGQEIFIDGQVFAWDDIDEIHVTETEIESDRLLPIIRQRRRSEGIVVGIPDEWYVARDGRDVTDRYIKGPPGSPREPGGSERHALAQDQTVVMVVHGHDSEAHHALFDWLRAVGLTPREWTELVQGSGSASPFIGQVLDRAFEEAQAVVVLFTPDEHVATREDLANGSLSWRLQARPNVLFEAGMAFATHPNRTVLVVLGPQDMPSDLAGRHFVRLDGSGAALQELSSRLEAAGCPIRRTGTQWLDSGRFPSRDLVSATPRSGLSHHGLPDSNLHTKLVRVLQDLVAVIAKSLNVSARGIGAHAWGISPDGERLQRLERVRIGDTPPNRPREWRKGEGVVGRCWETGEDAFLDLSAPEWAGVDETGFRQLSADLRMMLSWTEFERARLDFRAIWACPAYRRDRIIAIVSANLDSDYDTELSTSTKLVRDALRTAASKIELALP